MSLALVCVVRLFRYIKKEQLITWLRLAQLQLQLASQLLADNLNSDPNSGPARLPFRPVLCLCLCTETQKLFLRVETQKLFSLFLHRNTKTFFFVYSNTETFFVVCVKKHRNFFFVYRTQKLSSLCTERQNWVALFFFF